MVLLSRLLPDDPCAVRPRKLRPGDDLTNGGFALYHLLQGDAFPVSRRAKPRMDRQYRRASVNARSALAPGTGPCG